MRRPGALGPAILVLLAPSVCASCGDAPGDAPGATAVDSAGIRIVTNPPGSLEAAPEWSLSGTPAVEIGAGASPDVAVFRVTALEPLGDRRVAVGTDAPPAVRILGREGATVATLGGPGEGPGEFSTVTSVVSLGADSLAVWDQNRRRMSIFTDDGRFHREVDLSDLAPLSPMAAPSTLDPAAFTRLLPSAPGSLVLFANGVFGPGEGLRRVEVPSWRIGTDGRELARFGPFPGEELFDLGAGSGGQVPFPFGAGTHAVASGDALVVGTAEAPELRVHGPDGALERIVRWPDRDRSLAGAPVADWDAFVEGWLSAMPEGERAAVGQMLERVPRPERFPAYDALVDGGEGEVWVGEYAGEHTSIFPPRSAPVPARRWIVLDREGTVTATVRTPTGFQPRAVREGLVWGVFTDTLDIESIRAYGVVGR